MSISRLHVSPSNFLTKGVKVGLRFDSLFSEGFIYPGFNSNDYNEILHIIYLSKVNNCIVYTNNTTTTRLTAIKFSL